MSGTVLSDDTVKLISQLVDIQKRKSDLQERIKLFEIKLNMTRDASLAVTNEEHELVNKLQASGFFYGHSPVQPQPILTSPPATNALQGTQDQLAALLATLFQQSPTSAIQTLQAPTSNATSSIQSLHAPTSSNSSFGGSNIYNFPSPTSGFGQVMTPTIRAVPKVSPTSAPGMSIRRQT